MLEREFLLLDVYIMSNRRERGNQLIYQLLYEKCYICQGKPLLFLPFSSNFTFFPSTLTRHTIMFFTYNCCYLHLKLLNASHRMCFSQFHFEKKNDNVSERKRMKLLISDKWINYKERRVQCDVNEARHAWYKRTWLFPLSVHKSPLTW